MKTITLNPIPGLLVADLTHDQKASVRQRLDEMVQDRRRGLVPRALMHSTTEGSNTESRSKMRYRGDVSYGKASRSCCITHADVGWTVALKCTMWRRPCSRTKQP